MHSASQWHFGPFRLDLTQACLWMGATAVALPPKAFDVLRYLVTNPDRLVTKDELLEAVWPETAVSDAVVRVAIGALRKALGDTAQTPRFIATVSRRGYRFLAPVVAAAAASALPTVRHPPGAEPAAPADPSSQAPAFPDTLPFAAAEYRPLTVLFCDLVDSTRLAGQLGPEDYREVVRAYHQTCAEAIQRFEGTIAQYLGDGVLGYFGYPLAHEDDAQRAVWAGLGVLAALDALNARLALPAEEYLAVRLGVHTGLVVIDAVGTAAQQVPLALGETPNIAARLQQLAQPNTLVLSAAMYQLVAGYFTCVPLGEQFLRGLPQPLPVYQVVGPSGTQSRLEVATARGLTPLVGRAPDVALLVERWAHVQAGRGQVVLLVGEAGIGKSRLVQVLKEHVAAEAHTVIEWRGAPYYQHTALYPISDGLHRWLQWHPGEAPEATIKEIEALLTQAHLPLAEAMPLLAALLALPLPPARYLSLALAPEQQRQRTLSLLGALLGGLAEQQPVLLIAEDLHWMDPSTLEFLTRFLDEMPTARLYCVLTCRPTFQPPWGFRAFLTPLTLTRLTAPQVAAMIEGMPGGRHLPPAVIAQIVAQTDGVPLFVEEVTKAVLATRTDLAVPRPGVATHAGLAAPIPATLHEALLARLDRLGSAKNVAQLGAILGRQFSYALLRAVAPWEDEALQRDLAALVAAEIVYQRRQPPPAVYTFKHALLQDAAYASILQRERRQVHQRTLQALETQFPETAAMTPELLAHHALRGEQWDQAVAYLRQAGEHGMARSAYREAVAAFEQALAVVPHLPQHHDTLAQAIDLRFALRSALQPSGDEGRILAVLCETEALAAALADPHRLGQVSVSLSTHFRRLGAYDQAIAAAQRALALATTSGDVILQTLAHHYIGLGCAAQGAYRQAIDCLRQTIASLDGVRRHERFGQLFLPTVTSRGFLAVCYAELGMFAAGRAVGEEGLRIAEAVAHPGSCMWAYYQLGLLSVRQGDLRRACSLLEQAMGICHEGDHSYWLSPIASALSVAYSLDGRVADSMALLTQVLAGNAAMSAQFQALCSVPLGEVYVHARQLDEAYIQAQRALESARAHQERGHAAYALRLLGDVAAQRTPPETVQAEAHYQEALTLAEELGMRPLQAHCHRGLGTLYRQMARWDEARTALTTALDLYRAMEMPFWLPQTEAALTSI